MPSLKATPIDPKKNKAQKSKRVLESDGCIVSVNFGAVLLTTIDADDESVSLPSDAVTVSSTVWSLLKLLDEKVLLTSD